MLVARRTMLIVCLSDSCMFAFVLGQSQTHRNECVVWLSPLCNTISWMQIGNASLHMAALGNHIAVVQCLLQHKASATLQNNVGDVFCFEGTEFAYNDMRRALLLGVKNYLIGFTFRLEYSLGRRSCFVFKSVE